MTALFIAVVVIATLEIAAIMFAVDSRDDNDWSWHPRSNEDEP